VKRRPQAGQLGQEPPSSTLNGWDFLLDASGKYIYSMGSVEDLVTRQTAGESQWAVQATLRYAF